MTFKSLETPPWVWPKHGPKHCQTGSDRQEFPENKLHGYAVRTTPDGHIYDLVGNSQSLSLFIEPSVVSFFSFFQQATFLHEESGRAGIMEKRLRNIEGCTANKVWLLRGSHCATRTFGPLIPFAGVCWPFVRIVKNSGVPGSALGLDSRSRAIPKGTGGKGLERGWVGRGRGREECLIEGSVKL